MVQVHFNKNAQQTEDCEYRRYVTCFTEIEQKISFLVVKFN